MYGLIALGLFLLMLLAAVPLVVGPPLGRVASWLRRQSVGDDEATVTATQAALQRIGLVSGAATVVLAVVALVAHFQFYTSFAGYALAVVAGTCVPLGGSVRRADLSATGKLRSPAVLQLGAAVVLSIFTVVLALVSSLLLASKTDPYSVRTLPATFWMPDISLRQLAIAAGASALITVFCILGVRMAKRRQSIAGAAVGADIAVRNLCLRRLGLGTVGGQLILLAAVLPSLQVFTLDASSGAVNQLVVMLSSAAGAVLMTGGVITAALAVLLPVWLQPRSGGDTNSPLPAAIVGGDGLVGFDQRAKE